MSTLDEKVKASIQRLKAFEPEEGYALQFSGGKDSVVIKALADMANVKYDASYRLTSVDPPELVRFIKKEHSDVAIDIPRNKDGSQATMWNMIVKERMPPTRLARYCCETLKESHGKGKLSITGVRWAESTRRKNDQGAVTIIHEGNKKKRRQLAELADSTDSASSTPSGGIVLNYDNDESQRVVVQCYRTMKTLVNPIIDWEDKEVWEFIRANGIKYCGLYDEGFHRLGCVGCPMAGKHRSAQFARWPTYKIAYIHAFDRMLRERERDGLKPFAPNITNGEEVYHWWMDDGILPGQTDLFTDIDNAERNI